MAELVAHAEVSDSEWLSLLCGTEPPLNCIVIADPFADVGAGVIPVSDDVLGIGIAGAGFENDGVYAVTRDRVYGRNG